MGVWGTLRESHGQEKFLSALRPYFADEMEAYAVSKVHSAFGWSVAGLANTLRLPACRNADCFKPRGKCVP
jgi:hypothetical protein